MKISELLAEVPHFVLQGDESISVTGVCESSEECTEGILFVCIRGEKSDGHDYIENAIDAGATVVVVDDLSKTVYVTDKEVVLILVENTRKALGHIAAAWYGYPAKKLLTIGITGTKGKTSTAYMTRTILEKAGIKTGMLGTVELFDGEVSEGNVNTTPSAGEIQKWFARMVDNDCKAVVMEVSSQGMKHYRCEAITFDIGAFTNLKPDHIGEGEHKDFFEYRACKSRLFEQCITGIFNLDDEQTEYMLERATSKIRGYSINSDAHYTVSDIKKYKKNGVGMKFRFGNTPVKINLPGIFNVYNALCAIAITTECGVKAETIAKALDSTVIRGRCEYVHVSDEFQVILDYAHNAMSLKVLLNTIKEYSPERIVCLFGCGGNRSRLRRFEMGEVAGRLADYTIITSDNPRNEEPLKIIDDIVDGIKKTEGQYMVIVNREKAIEYAIKNAKKGDIVIIAGKGHETYQEINGVRYHMDDKEIILRNSTLKNK